MKVCPKCRKEVTELMLLTSPPKFRNACYSCGWQGEIRGGNSSDYIEIAT